MITFTPAFIRVLIPSGKGKKASEAATELFNFFCWNFLAFWVAILQLSILLGWPAPIPIVEKLFVITIELDLTNLLILNANSAFLSSFFVGLSLDKEVRKYKGYMPELSYNQRKEIISSIKYVDKVGFCQRLS